MQYILFYHLLVQTFFHQPPLMIHLAHNNIGFPDQRNLGKARGYDKATIKGNIQFADEYPGCPYCGGTQLTVCSCGHSSCTILKNGIFTCEWSKSQGRIGTYNGEAITAGTDI